MPASHLNKRAADIVKVASAVALLAAAVLLVRTVRIGRWSRSLGRADEIASIGRRPRDVDVITRRAQSAQRIGHYVERAARKLPFVAKCLPCAVAVQWLLRFRGIASDLVVAVHVTERSGDHAFHAWVEVGDDMVIGHCDRQQYRPVLIYANPAARRWALARL